MGRRQTLGWRAGAPWGPPDSLLRTRAPRVLTAKCIPAPHPPAPPPHPHQNWLWGPTSDSWAKDAVFPPPRSMFASAISSSQAPDRRTLHTQAHRPEHSSGCVPTGTRAGMHKNPVHTTQVHVDTTCTHGHTGQPPGTRSRRLAHRPALTHRLPPSVLGDSLPWRSPRS